MMTVVRDDPVVIDLVQRARAGDKTAWDQLVDRFAPLVWSICRGHGLTGADADDVGGDVWLRVVENLDGLREPAALAGWLATTARRECLRFLKSRNRQMPVDDVELVGEVAEPGPAADDELLAEERRIAIRTAFGDLEDRCRQLLTLLFSDPPAAYAKISADLDMPVGGIGPNRKRCLDRLRSNRALRDLDGRG